MYIHSDISHMEAYIYTRDGDKKINKLTELEEVIRSNEFIITSIHRLKETRVAKRMPTGSRNWFI